MLRRIARGLLLGLGVVAAVGIGVIAYAWFAMFGPGLSARDRARILATDAKFGMRAVDRAVRDGDALLEPLREASDDFTRLNGRNAPWIAEVLGRMEGDASLAVLRELHGRTLPLARLVGAAGLARRGALAGGAASDPALLALARTGIGTEGVLAIQVLGFTREPAGFAALREVVTVPGGYQAHAAACVALARRGDREAMPLLRACLESREFHALPEAFRALIALGDREAVPLAIARIGPDIQGRNSGFLVNELRTVTGRGYGWEREPWERWWREQGAGWEIPAAFRGPWDRQPRVR